MIDESNEPKSPHFSGPWGVSQSVTVRHDGWTGECMALFCEILAETGIVTRACQAVGKSRDTAYKQRRINPLFEAGWQAAISISRQRLADKLLESAIEGSVDYLYRDGELVGERRYVDNRLAYAMLRRMDKQAEVNPEPVRRELEREFKASPKLDWEIALTALRSGEEDDLRAALAMIKPLEDGETDETDNPPVSDEFEVFGTDRVWENEGCWRTNFPPPKDFEGEENGSWEESDYERDCTIEESEILDSAKKLSLVDLRQDEEAERESFFAELRKQVQEPDGKIE